MPTRPLDSWEQVGQRVAEAREAAGLTQGALAERINLERTALAKIESGSRGLSSLELARLALVLDRPIQSFVSESPPSVVSRRASSLDAPSRLDAIVEAFARDVELLLDLGSLKVEKPWTAHRVPESLTEAADLAAQVRGHLDLPEGPVTNLISLIEPLGLFTISEPLAESHPDGAYVALSVAGAVVINGMQDAGRRRFTLAHELGHHVMADEYSTDWSVAESRDAREKLVNAFAIHFLMPRPSVTRDWDAYGGPEDARPAATRIATDYRVSWSAACTQLQNLELIEAAEADALRFQPPTRADFLELGLFVIEELAPPAVSPRFASAALRAYRGGKIGGSRALELLRGTINEEELPAVDIVPIESLRRDLEAAQ